MTGAQGLGIEQRWPDLFEQLMPIPRAAVIQALASAVHEGWEPTRDDVANLVDYAQGTIDEAEYTRRADAAAEGR